MSENSEDCEYETIFFDIIEFLAEYEKLPCLWDKDHHQFKDRKERLRCEQILGEKLGIFDLKTLRRKIRSVRGTYNTEIRKLKYCLERGNDVYPPRLFWFPTADKFLRVTTDLPYDLFPLCTEQNTTEQSVRKKRLLEKLPRRKGVKLLTVATPRKQQKLEDHDFIGEEIDQEGNCEEETVEDYEEYEELESIEEQKNQDGDMSVKFETIDDFDQTEFDDNASVMSKVKPTHDLGNVVSYLKDLSSDNEFLAFGRSVGMQLKNMPLDLAVQLQMDIQAHITKTRLEYLRQAQRQEKDE